MYLACWRICILFSMSVGSSFSDSTLWSVTLGLISESLRDITKYSFCADGSFVVFCCLKHTKYSKLHHWILLWVYVNFHFLISEILFPLWKVAWTRTFHFLNFSLIFPRVKFQAMGDLCLSFESLRCLPTRFSPISAICSVCFGESSRCWKMPWVFAGLSSPDFISRPPHAYSSIFALVLSAWAPDLIWLWFADLIVWKLSFSIIGH